MSDICDRLRDSVISSSVLPSTAMDFDNSWVFCDSSEMQQHPHHVSMGVMPWVWTLSDSRLISCINEKLVICHRINLFTVDITPLKCATACVLVPSILLLTVSIKLTMTVNIHDVNANTDKYVLHLSCWWQEAQSCRVSLVSHAPADRVVQFYSQTTVHSTSI